VRLLYVLPTGGGKTVVLAAIMAQLVARGQRCLFLVHRKELVWQTVKHLALVGVDAGMVLADVRARPEQPVQVASVQTLVKPARLAKEKEGAGYDLLIVDECHHSVADSYRAIRAAFPAAAVLGATATPYRLDNKPLWPTFTSARFGPTTEALTNAGFLVPARVFVCQAQVATAGVKMSMGDFATGALSSSARVITGEWWRNSSAWRPPGRVRWSTRSMWSTASSLPTSL
jgi:superfamily II DNA or RNA helicase